jgi:hypothetical protein
MPNQFSAVGSVSTSENVTLSLPWLPDTLTISNRAVAGSLWVSLTEDVPSTVAGYRLDAGEDVEVPGRTRAVSMAAASSGTDYSMLAIQW